MKKLNLILGVFFIYFCLSVKAGAEEEMLVMIGCLANKDQVLRFTNKLNDISISYKLQGESKCIYTISNYSNKAKEEFQKFAGIEPPWGLNVSYNNQNEDTIKLLKENGIETKIYHYYGMDFIVWSYQDRMKVEELLGFSKEKREMLKEMRSQYKKNHLTKQSSGLK